MKDSTTNPQDARKECKILINIIDQKGCQLLPDETIDRLRNQLATELTELEAAALTARYIEPYHREEPQSALQEYYANFTDF